MQVHYTAEIVKNLRKLVRRYRHIEDDLQSLIDQLQAGDTPGDQVTGTGYPVYKVRVKNRDIREEKSGGCRLIYYLQTSDACVLVTIYPKSDCPDIPPKIIRELIAAYLSEPD